MTSAPDHVLRWRGLDVARWSLCAVMILAVHAGAAAYIMTREPGGPAGSPAAIALEMLPEVAAPQIEPKERPPGPEMEKTEDQPEKRAEKPDDEEATTEAVKPPEAEPEAPPAPKAQVAVAPPREPEPPAAAKPVERKRIEAPKRPEPKKKQTKKPNPATTAPPPSAPAVASSAASDAMPGWNQTISTLMKRNLRYPSDAERRGIRGVARVSLSISRDGHLTSASLVDSSGDSQLDQEAVAVARRTAPFPPPPDSRPATRVIPIRFGQ
jgi:protein TonB